MVQGVIVKHSLGLPWTSEIVQRGLLGTSFNLQRNTRLVVGSSSRNTIVVVVIMR